MESKAASGSIEQGWENFKLEDSFGATAKPKAVVTKVI
jgi:hypothetical protein